ncbi:SET and MYND domain-containing protein 4-like [Artemia franciscana]|uniref:SET domain-containing protein n=1 Tax=Artemia franciscana TaxID=6661 RepID=A0AA88I4I1_ARTSF|nr:hypothetical protein QYM36_010021 [Artemia franciscana]
MKSSWQELLVGPLVEKIRDKIQAVKNEFQCSHSPEHVYGDESIFGSQIMKEISNVETKEIIFGWLNDCEPEKSAVEWKNMGNQYFKEKRYRESLGCYTKSADTSVGEDRAVAISNRSASLFFLEQYEDCLLDVESVYDLVPTMTKAKLDLRKSKCEMLIHKEKLIKNKNIDELPELLAGENKLITSMSAALTVPYSQTKGRHVITTKFVHAGDTLFKEQPYTAVLLAKNGLSHCSFCFRKVSEQYVVCRICGDAVYCDYECRKSDKSHDNECGLAPFLQSLGIAHLVWKIITGIGIEKLADVHDNCLLETVTNENIVHCYEDKENPYLSVLYLNSHILDMNSGDLAQYAMSALMLNLFLKLKTNVYAGFDDDIFNIVSNFFLRHICQMICNAHAITELSEDSNNESNLVLESQDRIATAIYPSASLMNHACDPTIINSFSGRTLIVRAVKDVKTGGEIFHCYGPHFARTPTPERRESLKLQYFFDCGCPYCTDPKLTDLNQRFFSFACTYCKGSLSIKKSKKAFCKDCGKEQNYCEQLEAESQALQLHREGIDGYKENKIETATFCFTKAFKLREKALYKHHLNLAETADWLARLLAMVGKYVECLQTLEIVLEGLRLRYGELSIEIGYEMRKRSDVLISALQNKNLDHKIKRKFFKKLRDSLELTVKIFEIHYGSWSDPYKEAKSRLEIFSGFNF